MFDRFLGVTIARALLRMVERSMTIDDGMCSIVWFVLVSVIEDVFLAEEFCGGPAVV